MQSIAVLPTRPRKLYTFEQLYDGFNPHNPQSFVATRDFKTFRQFVRDGKAAPRSLDVRLRQAEHDAHISNALQEYLSEYTRLVGVMGGHSLKRDSPAYRKIAELSREIARNKFLIISGGGPGAMEAAHLGATFLNSEDAPFQRALNEIARVPALPNLADLILPDGEIAPNRDADIRAAHEWICAALKAKSFATRPHGDSLGIPTYLYGEEPTTPFATRYAKYFQNSIREEALVTGGRTGVIYARGGGGTMREIFEDFEPNYYAASVATFTPMIFVDPDGYWENDAQFDPKSGDVVKPGIKIDLTIQKIVRFSRARTKDADECQKKILFTTDIRSILGILEAQTPVAHSQMKVLVGKDRPR